MSPQAVHTPQRVDPSPPSPLVGPFEGGIYRCNYLLERSGTYTVTVKLGRFPLPGDRPLSHGGVWGRGSPLLAAGFWLAEWLPPPPMPLLLLPPPPLLPLLLLPVLLNGCRCRRRRRCPCPTELTIHNCLSPPAAPRLPGDAGGGGGCA